MQYEVEYRECQDGLQKSPVSSLSRMIRQLYVEEYNGYFSQVEAAAVEESVGIVYLSPRSRDSRIESRS